MLETLTAMRTLSSILSVSNRLSNVLCIYDHSQHHAQALLTDVPDMCSGAEVEPIEQSLCQLARDLRIAQTRALVSVTGYIPSSRTFPELLAHLEERTSFFDSISAGVYIQLGLDSTVTVSCEPQTT